MGISFKFVLGVDYLQRGYLHTMQGTSSILSFFISEALKA